MITEMIKNVAVNAAKIGAGVLIADTAVFTTKKAISNRKESKVVAEEKEVEIEEVEVGVGRTGKMTFRARFKEPVRLCGTSVLRATLHNMDYIRSVLKEGVVQAREIAVKTLEEVRSVMNMEI